MGGMKEDEKMQISTPTQSNFLCLRTIAKEQAEHKVYCRRDPPGMASNPTLLWCIMRRRSLLSSKETSMLQTQVFSH